MADTSKSMPRDANRQVIFSEDWGNTVEKTITFAGGTANAIGDYDGTGDPFTIFTVTGEVVARVYAVCTTDLVGAATIEVGVNIAGQTAKIIAQTTATDIDAGNIWHDASPDSSVEATSVLTENLIANGEDIVGSIGAANITAGVIKFICAWYPLSANGKVEAA